MGDIDLLHPPKELELRRHKLKRLVPSPNSFFMDVKCPGCFNITTVFSRADCGHLQRLLGGALPADGWQGAADGGCSFRKKVE